MVDLNITLPDGFLDEEVRCGYTITSEMKKVWAVQIDMLCKLDAVCRRHNLTYFADSGTLIGAIRHKGYIPWDDDIDVVMMREDYDRLLRLSDEFEYPFFLQSNYTDKNFHHGFARVRNSETTEYISSDVNTEYNKGIFIDIFPLDNLPDDEKKYETYKKDISRQLELMAISYFSYKTSNTIKGYIKRILACITRLMIPYKTSFKIYEKLCGRYSKKKTERISWVAFKCGVEEQYIWRRDWFESSRQMPFEFINVPVPNGYDGRLRKEYGDYMEMKQEPSSHKTIFLSADIPYTEYCKENNLQ